MGRLWKNKVKSVLVKLINFRKKFESILLILDARL